MTQPIQLFLAVLATVLLASASTGAVLRLRYRAAGAGRVLPAITAAAIGVNLVTLVWQMVSLGPSRALAFSFDFTVLLATLIAVAGLIAQRIGALPGLDSFLLPVATAIQTIGFLFVTREPAAGVDAAWFIIHPVSLALGATLLTCGGTAGVVYLTMLWYLRRRDLTAMMGRLAPLESWERFVRRSLAAGFALFSFGILTGICEMVQAVDPPTSAWTKNEFIISSFVIWGVYMLTVLASWLVPSFRGRRTAWLAAGSAAALVFVILVVDMLSPIHR